MKRLFLALGGALSLSLGCAYAFSPSVADRADPSLTFAQLLADPDLYQGKLLILGGTIETVSPLPRGSLITVIQRPLDYWNRPIRTARTGGRFILYHPAMAESFQYALGRDLSVAAEVAGSTLAAAGGKEFADPVLISKELRVWESGRPQAGAPRWDDPLHDRYSPGRPE